MFLAHTLELVQDLEANYGGGVAGFVRNRGYAVENVHRIAKDLYAAQRSVESSSGKHPRTQERRRLAEQAVERLTKQLQGAIEQARSFEVFDHLDTAPEFAGSMRLQETPRQDQQDLVVGLASLLIGGGAGIAGKIGARVATGALRSRAAGKAQGGVSGLAGDLGAGASKTAASMAANGFLGFSGATVTAVLEYDKAVQDHLKEAGIAERSATEVHAYLQDNPGIAKEARDKAIQAGLANWFGARTGGAVGRGARKAARSEGAGIFADEGVSTATEGLLQNH